MKPTFLLASVGILNWNEEYSKDREIDKVVWGYREKPDGVPNNHAGDIFLVFKNKKILPKVVGISLKAGTKSSKEPKLNSYVGNTFFLLVHLQLHKLSILDFHLKFLL